MRRLAPLLTMAFVATLAQAGSSDAYLRLRTQHKITQASVSPALRGFVGTRVLELQGRIDGTCRIDGTTVLVLRLDDRNSEEVEAKAVPAWLDESNGPVRLLVKALRAEKGASLKLVLLAAAPESDVATYEEAYWRKEAARRRAAERKAAPASRGATPARSPLSGPIGGRRANGPKRDWVLPASEVTPRYAAFIRGRNPRLSSGEAMRIAQALVGFSLRYRVDARLVMAMLLVESDFNPNAVSRSGAIGLGQLMPGTAQWMGVRNSYDTTDNLYGTVKLLRTHLDQYHAVDGEGLSLVLAAYNAGSGAVRRHGGVPPYRETQAYVRRVKAIYYRLCGLA